MIQKPSHASLQISVPQVIPTLTSNNTDWCHLLAKWCLTLCDPVDYIAHQAPLSMGFPKQEYWNGVPFAKIKSFS